MMMSVFAIRVILDLQNEFGSIHTSSLFLEELEEGLVFFFKCLVGFTSEAVWSWGFIVGSFITVFIFLLVTGLFSFLVESVLVVSRGLSIHLDYLICWHTIVHSILL